MFPWCACIINGINFFYFSLMLHLGLKWPFVSSTKLIFYFRLMGDFGFCDIVSYSLKADFLNVVYSKQTVYGFQMLIVTCSFC